MKIQLKMLLFIVHGLISLYCYSCFLEVSNLHLIYYLELCCKDIPELTYFEVHVWSCITEKINLLNKKTDRKIMCGTPCDANCVLKQEKGI